MVTARDRKSQKPGKRASAGRRSTPARNFGLLLADYRRYLPKVKKVYMESAQGWGFDLKTMGELRGKLLRRHSRAIKSFAQESDWSWSYHPCAFRGQRDHHLWARLVHHHRLFFDPEYAIWYFASAKAGRPRRFPLSAEEVELLLRCYCVMQRSLRHANKLYRKELNNCGEIDKALSRTRMHLRGSSLSKARYWREVSTALASTPERGKQRFSPSDVAAMLASLAVKDPDLRRHLCNKLTARKLK